MTTYKLLIRKFFQDRNGVIALIILSILFVAAIIPSSLAPHPDDFGATINPRERLEAPSPKHLCGTDHMGRDIFSRLIGGARVSLMLCGIATGSALLIGTLVGLIAGYYEGWIGLLLMRISDIFVSLPQIVMALVIVAALGAGIKNAILALAVTDWPVWSRVVYADVISIKKSPFIEAAKALGTGTTRIMFLHILPNIVPNIIIRSTIGMGGTILTAAVLSYVGLGAQPPISDWGLDLSSSRAYLPTAWWYALFPGLAIFLAVMAFNMAGDTLRDVLDPKLRRSRKET